jgi:hypothetical protein
MRVTTFPNALAGLLVLLSACSSGPPPSTSPKPAEGEESEFRSQYPSTYQRKQNPPVFIRNATVLTAAGPEMQHASVYFKDGLIVSVGADTTAPADAVVGRRNREIRHSRNHRRPQSPWRICAPGTWAESDGNEATSPVTANVWAEHSFWPQDPEIPLAIAGGITVIQALPGSANLIGGRSATLRLFRRAASRR